MQLWDRNFLASVNWLKNLILQQDEAPTVDNMTSVFKFPLYKKNNITTTASRTSAGYLKKWPLAAYQVTSTSCTAQKAARSCWMKPSQQRSSKAFSKLLWFTKLLSFIIYPNYQPTWVNRFNTDLPLPKHSSEPPQIFSPLQKLLFHPVFLLALVLCWIRQNRKLKKKGRENHELCQRSVCSNMLYH